MKNKMKMLAIAAVLVSSVAQVDAGTGSNVKKMKDAGNVMIRNTWDWQLVDKFNGLFPYAEGFPGTWPLNRVEVNTDEDYLRPIVSPRSFMNFTIPLGNFGKMLADGGLPNTNGNHPINPSIQLGFTVLCKWLPVALIVRGIYKVATKKKKKHHKKHDKKAHHVVLNA